MPTRQQTTGRLSCFQMNRNLTCLGQMAVAGVGGSQGMSSLGNEKAKELLKIINEWLEDIYYYKNYKNRRIVNNKTELIRPELVKQIEEAKKINDISSASSSSLSSDNLTYKTHPEAIYTSRLLNFDNLPEPRNSDDYYKNYDNISSVEYLGI